MNLPPNIMAGHIDPEIHAALPAGFTADCRIGQLVDVRDPRGRRYLLSSDGEHVMLHRRVTPDAAGHARNALEVGPPLGFAINPGE